MSLHEYTGILIKGYLENRDNLAKYLIRVCKKAENEFIDNEEFFDGLNKVIELFHTDIDVQYIAHLNQIDQMRDIRLNKGQSIEDLEGQEKNKEHFYVFLPRVTGNIFLGNLPFQDVLFLESEISRAQELISVEGNKKNEVEKLDKQVHRSDLSAFEIALKHWYLVEAKIEDYIIPKHVGEKYKNLANYKNIEKSFGDLDTKPRRREPNLKNLNKVKKSLIDFPKIQRAIQNDIDKLN